VKVVRRDERGGDMLLAEMGDGAFFGEMALLSDVPRTATVVVTEDATLFEIPRVLVDEIMVQYPGVRDVLRRFTQSRLLTNLLRTSPVFAPFSPKDQKRIIERFKARTVAAGALILARDRPGDGLYVLLAGGAVVFDVDVEGRELLLAELHAGDVFGEMSLLWRQKTGATVRATSMCVVLRMPREAFDEVLLLHPELFETLSALADQRLQHNESVRRRVFNDYIL
jgi:CRP-like cAMP-binding protein